MTFTDRVYALCRQIPRGRITTYAELARAAGSPQASRAVDNAMRLNPDAPTTPCHRVVGSQGQLTGYAYGLDRKVELLEQEGVCVRDGVADLSKLFRFGD